MSNARYKSCYVAAPAGMPLPGLFGILDKLAVTHNEFSLAESSSDALNQVFAESDFVLGYLPAETELSSTYFELGYAAALGKPLFLIVEHGADFPVYLRQFPYVLGKQDEPSILSMHMQAFLKHFRPQQKGVEKSEQKRPPNLTKEREIYESLLKSGGMGRSAYFEQLLWDVLNKSGFTAASVSVDEQFEIAMWIDGLEPIVSNPILIKGIWSLQNVHENTITGFQEQIEKCRAQFGIIVYFVTNTLKKTESHRSWPPILVLSLGELIDLVASRKLASEIVSYRNDVVHGRSQDF